MCYYIIVQLTTCCAQGWIVFRFCRDFFNISLISLALLYGKTIPIYIFTYGPKWYDRGCFKIPFFPNHNGTKRYDRELFKIPIFPNHNGSKKHSHKIKDFHNCTTSYSYIPVHIIRKNPNIKLKRLF